MLKPDKNFRMPNKYKSMLRLIKGSDEIRNLWKSSFIQATLASEQEYKTSKTKKGE